MTIWSGHRSTCAIDLHVSPTAFFSWAQRCCQLLLLVNVLQTEEVRVSYPTPPRKFHSIILVVGCKCAVITLFYRKAPPTCTSPAKNPVWNHESVPYYNNIMPYRYVWAITFINMKYIMLEKMATINFIFLEFPQLEGSASKRAGGFLQSATRTCKSESA